MIDDPIRLYWRPWHRRVLKTPRLFLAHYRIFRKDCGIWHSLRGASLMMRVFWLVYWRPR